jgi:hypothetical protein
VWEHSSQGPIAKIFSTKRAGRVSQVVECLPREHEALNTTKTTTTTKKAARKIFSRNISGDD